MAECHPSATPVDTKAKLSASDGSPVVDPTHYWSLAGALQYLTLTQLDLAYVVQQVCLYMHDPRDPHLAFVKQILCYVTGTMDHSLQLHISPASTLTSYSNVDLEGCPYS